MIHFLQPLLGLLLAPLLLGVINRTKATVAGRTGQPLIQPYLDVWKLLQKGAVFSTATTAVFRAGPVVSLATAATALFVIPLADVPAPVAFAGDFLLVAYLLGLGRFFTVAAALDTGSAFEGMGASREVFFSALAEPALLVGMAALARLTGTSSLSVMMGAVGPDLWGRALPVLLLVGATFALVLLSENSRIPVDDPTTHLELTMIHEVMVLDHSGPDFAFISYGAALKLWAFGAILVGVALPVRGLAVPLTVLAFLAGMLLLGVWVGLVESVMARLRLDRVPKLLLSASLLAALGLFVQQW